MTYARGDATKARLLAVGIICARTGLQHVTHRYIARMAGADHSTVHYHFKTAGELLDAVAVEAVRRGDGMVIARLILDRHASVSPMTPADRLEWLRVAASV